jgi:hypothetical protein
MIYPTLIEILISESIGGHLQNPNLVLLTINDFVCKFQRNKYLY